MIKELITNLQYDSIINICYELYRLLHKAEDGVDFNEFRDTNMSQNDFETVSAILLDIRLDDHIADKEYISYIFQILSDIDETIISNHIDIEIRQLELKELELSEIDLKYINEYDKLGFVENRLKDLQHVYVFATEVEKPKDELLKAVRENIFQNIKYTFIVSKENRNKINDYYNYFLEFIPETIVETMIKIYYFDFNWKYGKHIFYQMDNDLTNDELNVIGYKGIEIESGVTTKYNSINSSDSKMILNLAIKGVSKLRIISEDLSTLTRLGTIYNNEELNNIKKLIKIAS